MNANHPGASSRTVSVGEHVLAWRDVGEGEPVLLLHSGGFSSRQWRKLAEALVPSFRTLAPDLLGYGASSPWRPGEPFHLRQELTVLERLVDEVGMPMHIVGHSYGGFLALQLALSRPGAVRTLALYEPVAFGVLEAQERAELLAMPPYDSTLGTDEAWLARFIDFWNGPNAWKALNAETQGAFRSVGWKVSEEVAGLVKDTTPLETYGGISVPTLLLGGQTSPAFEQRVLTKLAGAMPGARLHLFPGVGHMGPITHAVSVNAVIVRHLLDAAAAPS
jgi:pimeloyl-ACP methyl ester carboxylesterase